MREHEAILSGYLPSNTLHVNEVVVFGSVCFGILFGRVALSQGRHCPCAQQV